MRFVDRVVIVTGAGGGLGREHALALARLGASVVVNDLGGRDASVGRELGDAAKVVAEIEAAGGRAVASTASVTDPAGVAELVAAALEAFGRVDAVVNNAGILRSRELSEMDDATWDAVLDVNLTGSYLVTRAVWPLLAAQGSGRVVFTSSNSGLLGTPGSSAYAASKAALWGLVRVLALEGADHGIKVNAIAPIALTDMSRTSRAAPQRWRDGDLDDWGRRLDPSSVPPVVAWLCHDDCTLSGEVLSVAGGRVARFFLGLTPGIVSDDLTPDEVGARVDEIVREAGYAVHRSAVDEGKALHRRLFR